MTPSADTLTTAAWLFASTCVLVSAHPYILRLCRRRASEKTT